MSLKTCKFQLILSHQNLIPCRKKFLLEHLPPEQVSSPQKAHELAVRFENHVALTTTTKVYRIDCYCVLILIFHSLASLGSVSENDF